MEGDVCLKRILCIYLLILALLCGCRQQQTSSVCSDSSDITIMTGLTTQLTTGTTTRRTTRRNTTVITIPKVETTKSITTKPTMYTKEQIVRLVSHNIYCGDDVKGRAPLLQAQLQAHDPDVIGFQEVTEEWLNDHLVPFLSRDYEYISRWRAESNREGVPIFWKKDKFALVDHGFFWLSDTPEQESVGWDAEHVRLVSWVKLRIKSTGKEFLYYNTHYDFSEVCHLNSSDLILRKMREQGGFTKYGVLLTGDLNMVPWSVGYTVLIANGELEDINAALQSDDTNTFNNFTEEGMAVIDYGFYSPGNVLPLRYEVMPGKINGEWISDHNGLCMEVVIL